MRRAGALQGSLTEFEEDANVHCFTPNGRTRRNLLPTVFWVVLGVYLAVSNSAGGAIDVVDRTGLDTDLFPFRTEIENSVLYLAGKVRSRTASGAQIVGDIMLNVSIQDISGRQLLLTTAPVRRDDLGTWYRYPIARSLPSSGGTEGIDLDSVARIVVTIEKLTTSEDIERTRVSVIRRSGWPRDVQDRIIKRQVWIGMAAEQARLALGPPATIHESVTAGGKREVWSYSELLRLYFDRGKLIEIQRTR
jgi:hypothetical protein